MKNLSVTQLRFLCLGVGAIGAYIGGSLALSGQRVVFMVRRPKNALELKRTGLRLEIGGGKIHYSNPDVVSSIEEALTKGPYDVILFSVKAYDTKAVIKYMSPYFMALPPFLCMQNGVENEQILAEKMGAEKVIPASITSAVSKMASGEVVLERLRGIGIASGHALAPALVAVFEAAGLNARLYQNADSMKWSKMLTNLLANATSAILDMTPGEIYAQPELYDLEMKQLRETLQVMEAMKIPVTNLPGAPVRALSTLVRFFPESISQPLLTRFIGRGRGDKMPSFHVDISQGRTKSEVSFLNGAVEKYGILFGIETPVNSFLNQTLTAILAGELERDAFMHMPEKFLYAFHRFEKEYSTSPLL